MQACARFFCSGARRRHRRRNRTQRRPPRHVLPPTLGDVDAAQQAWCDGLLGIAKAHAEGRDYKSLAQAVLSNNYNYDYSIVLGTGAIIVLLGRYLLPERNGESLPSDFSRHARTLVEQYRITDGLLRLRVRASSPYVGAPRSAIMLGDYPSLSLVSIQTEGARARATARRSPRAM